MQNAKADENPLNAFVYGDLAENRFAWELISNLLIYSASKIPEIADDFLKIDNAMKWGYNWEMGPFEIWDAIGFQKASARMKNEGRVLPRWIEDRLAAGEQFIYSNEKFENPFVCLKSCRNILKNDDASLIDLGDEVACLEFTSKGNTITDNVIQMIYDSG